MKNKTVFIILATVFTTIFLVWMGIRITQSISFNQGCKQYLKRAADASTVEVAKSELEKAIAYAEKNNLTEGVVSVFFKQPKNDVGFWYNNMLSAYNELNTMDENTSTLEQTNMLMRLRESLVDETEDGIEVTVPDGISVYPNNKFFFWMGIVSFFMMIGLWFWVYMYDAVYYE